MNNATEKPMKSGYQPEYDVIIAGGGTAGWVAALEAARSGRTVLVIERKGYLGGTLGSGLPIHGFFDTERRQVVSGIAEEFIQRLRKNNGGGEFHHTDLWFTVFVVSNPTVVKATIFEMLFEAGVDILLFSQLVGVQGEIGNITSVQVQTKESISSFAAKGFVDSSGDAVLCQLANLPMMVMEECQPPSLVFRLENVDTGALRAYVNEHPEKYPDNRMLPGRKLTSSFFQSTLFFYLHPAEDGKIPFVGDYSPYINRLMFSITPGDTGVIVNMLRAHNIDGRSSEGLSRAGIDLYRNLVPLTEYFRAQIPGFEKCTLCDSEPEIQLRETRRIDGEYALTTEDVINGKTSTDGIAVGGYYIDIHSSNSSGGNWRLLENSYEIPFGCLVPKKIDNVVVAGRCISGSKNAAASYRVMATCMAMGQAAGLAASMSVTSGTAMRELPASRLRTRLSEEGAIVRAPR